jgi:hypothetical protein
MGGLSRVRPRTASRARSVLPAGAEHKSDGGAEAGTGSGAAPAAEEDDQSDGVFLFQPEDADSSSGPNSPPAAATPLSPSAAAGGGAGGNLRRYVVGESIEVDVVLLNPLRFELILQRLSLSAVGAAFEPYPVSLALPPHSKPLRVRLTGKALAPGTLTLRGVHIRAFNLMCEHTVHSTHPSASPNPNSAAAIDAALQMQPSTLPALPPRERERLAARPVPPVVVDVIPPLPLV